MLFNHYLTVQLELGPVVSTMSDEEVNAWITRIGEGGSAFPFDLLSSEIQKILVLTMAKRLVHLTKERSSVGSQPEEPPTSEDEPLPQPPTLEE